MRAVVHVLCCAMLMLVDAACVAQGSIDDSRGAPERSGDSKSQLLDLLPSIASFKVDGMLDLPPDAAAAWQVPAKFNLVANYKATAKQVDQRPRYSSYEADFVLRITDAASQRIFVEVSTGLSGTVKETPDQAVGRPLKQLLDALEVLDRAPLNRALPATAPTTAPSTAPASQPVGFRAELNLSNLDIQISPTQWDAPDGHRAATEVGH